MNDYTPRFLFSALCLVGMTAIGCGAGFEILRQKRGATISRRHFRWRMVSAALWMLILASLAYATFFLWPIGPNRVVLGRRFLAVVVGAMALMLIGFLLMIFDFYLTAKTRQIQSAHLQIELGELARHEIEEARRAQLEAKIAAENQSGDAAEKREP